MFAIIVLRKRFSSLGTRKESEITGKGAAVDIILQYFNCAIRLVEFCSFYFLRPVWLDCYPPLLFEILT